MLKSAKSSNKGLTLLEVLVAVAILGVGIVFIFRSFFTVLAAEGLSQDIMENCYLAEEYLWQIEMGLKSNPEVVPKEIKYKISDIEPIGLKEVDLSVTKNKNTLDFKSYSYKRN